MKISSAAGRLFKGILITGAVLSLFAGCGANRKKAVVEEAVWVDTGRHVSIVFAGDVMLHMSQITAAKRDSTYDFTETFRYIKPFFDSADLVIVNLETTVSADGHYSGYPIFSSPREIAAALKGSGVDVVMLANNHICDKGARGIAATVEAVTDAGLEYTGAFADSAQYHARNPLMLEIKGVRLAILNYTYGTNGLPVPKGMAVNLIDTAAIAADLRKIDRNATDHIVVYLHWGVEYAVRPEKEQRELAAWCREQGADIIIGNHPHVLQPMQAFFGDSGGLRGLTVYSLGNLVSNQQWRYADGGMAVRLDITRYDSLPTVMEAGYMLAWVHRHHVGNRNYYHILPSFVADTMLKEGGNSHAAYDLFISDSRKLMADSSGFREIRALE